MPLWDQFPYCCTDNILADLNFQGIDTLLDSPWAELFLPLKPARNAFKRALCQRSLFRGLKVQNLPTSSI